MSTWTGAPRPRVLVHGLTDEEIEIVRSLAGSVVVARRLSDAHPEEHDVLIFTNAQFHTMHRTYSRRLAFSPAPGVSRVIDHSAWGMRAGKPETYTHAQEQERPARDFDLTDDAKSLGLAGLVARSVRPAAESKYTGIKEPVFPERTVRPLIKEALVSPLTLAAVLELRSIEEELTDSVIWLPDVARSAFREWVSFALSYWRAEAPDLFPISAEWTGDDKWSSLDEISIRAQIAEFERQEEARLQAIDHERQTLATSLDQAVHEGDAWRAMLTDTGDALVTAVKEAFEYLGFFVLDADELPQHKAAKREDLRVSDGEWTALVEVKGYAGAAKSNDLSQVSRAAMAYAMNEQREPDALWYVPNIERETAPASRNTALVGRDDDLASFAENYHGALIDTRDLFAVRQRVVNGTTSPEEARQELKSATGRYTA
ncbi:hypothetical protein [Microbacterium forte]